MGQPMGITQKQIEEKAQKQGGKMIHESLQGI
jgi:hypothetical protein